MTPDQDRIGTARSAPVDRAAIDRAQRWLEDGRPEEAVHDLDGVLSAAPGNAEAWMIMTRARLMLDDTGAALVAANTAVGLAPKDPRALAMVSLALSACGRHDEAVLAAHRAVAYEPENPSWHDITACVLLAGDLRPEQAERAARKAVRLDPQHPPFHVTLGFALAAMGRRGPARESLRTALRLDPENEVAQHELAQLDAAVPSPLATGPLAQAAVGAEALRVNPELEESRYTLDLALRSFLTGVAYLAPAACLLGAWLARRDQLPAVRLLTIATVLAATAVAVRFVRELNPELRRYLGLVLSAGRRRTATTLLALSGTGLLAVAAGPSSWAVPLLLAGAVTLLLVRVTAAGEAIEYRRTRGGPAGKVIGDHVVWTVSVACLAVTVLALLPATGGTNGAGAALGFGTAAGCLVIGVLWRRRRSNPGRRRVDGTGRRTRAATGEERHPHPAGGGGHRANPTTGQDEHARATTGERLRARTTTGQEEQALATTGDEVRAGTDAGTGRRRANRASGGVRRAGKLPHPTGKTVG